jgi:hypothetical protein
LNPIGLVAERFAVSTFVCLVEVFSLSFFFFVVLLLENGVEEKARCSVHSWWMDFGKIQLSY